MAKYRRFLLAALALVLMLGMPAALAARTPVASIKLNAAKKTMNVGASFQLLATISPADATNKRVTWTSSDKSVATVSSTGRVKGIKAGSATITCKARDGSGVQAKCKITVKPVRVTSVKLNKKRLTLDAGASYTLKPTVKPANAGNKALAWTTSDESVAQVSSEGAVRAIGSGVATITCKSTDGSGKKASCKVTVRDAVVYVSGIALNRTSASMDRGDTLALTAEISPANATNKQVSWTTSDANVATVSGNGVVTATGAGKANIICAARDGGGARAVCQVTVSSSESVQDMVFRIVNEERVKNGLAPLNRRMDVEARALIRAKEIVTLFSHTRPDGTSCFTALAGISYRAAGENIAAGYRTPEAVMEGWMNSSGHRANILNGNFTGIGIGAYQENGVWHWVQLFVG